MADKKVTYSNSTQYISGKVYLVHPHLVEPSAFSEGDTPMYSVMAMIDKDNTAEYENWKAVVTKIWLLSKLKAKDHNPILDGDIKAQELEEDGKNGDFYKNKWYIKLNSKFKVGIVDSKKLNFVGDDIDINGHLGRFAANFCCYEAAKGKGIKGFLKKVQVLGKGIEVPNGGGDNFFDVETVDDSSEELPF